MVVNNIARKNSNSKISVDDNAETNDYCNDCLYSWCSKRDQVSYCTMKSKGLFECRSCMIKLMSAYEKELLINDETKMTKSENLTLTI